MTQIQKRSKRFPASRRLFILVSLLVSILKAEPPHLLTPETVARKMAQRLFQDSGYSVLVRSTQSLTDCKQVDDGADGWVIPQDDLATEFLYSPHAICVAVFVRTDPTAKSAIRFDPSAFQQKFGPVPAGAFVVRERFAFVFPDDPSSPPDESTLELFFRKVPRPVNLQHAGSLAAAMNAVESPEAGSQFASELEAAAPASPAQKALSADPKKVSDVKGGPSLKMPWAMLLTSMLLSAPAVYFFWRFRSRARKTAPEKLTSAVQTPAPAETSAAASNPHTRRPGRRLLSFPVKNAEDQKLVTQIDALVLDLTTKGDIRWSDVDTILKKADSIKQLAIKENLPALEIVKEFLTDQVKLGKIKNRAIPGLTEPR